MDAAKRTKSSSCLGVLATELDRLGFEPAADEPEAGTAIVAFLHCPFRELAEAYPDLVCNLHRGICEGVVDRAGGGSVEDFSTLYDPEPCQVSVGLR